MRHTSLDDIIAISIVSERQILDTNNMILHQTLFLKFEIIAVQLE